MARLTAAHKMRATGARGAPRRTSFGVADVVISRLHPQRSLLQRILLVAAVVAGQISLVEAGPSNEVYTVQIRKQSIAVMKQQTLVGEKTAYYGTLSVGSPVAQNFTVIFDTGSGHLILPTTSCLSEACASKRRFDRKASQTAVEVDHHGAAVPAGSLQRDQLAITFGTGQVKGQFLEDLVCVGDTVQHCTKVDIVLATDMTSDPFNEFDFDGVLGLGLGRLSLTPGFSFLQSLLIQSPGLTSEFAVFLSENDAVVASEISFGGRREERQASPVQWTPVADPELGYWQVRIEAVTIGDHKLDICDQVECRAILDSGTSLMGVPRSVLAPVHRLLARAVPEGADVDCRGFPGAQVTFQLFGGFSLDVGPRDYSRAAPAAMAIVGGAAGETRNFCRASLLPVSMQMLTGAKTAVFIFGEPLLRRYYTTFDWGARRVGFALARQPSAEALAARASQLSSSGGDQVHMHV